MLCRLHAGQRTTLANQPDDLLGQRIVQAAGGGWFGHLASAALRVDDVDRHLGAANVDTGHRLAVGGQTEPLG